MKRAEVCRISREWLVDIFTTPRSDTGRIAGRAEHPLAWRVFPTHTEALAWALDQTKERDR